MQKLPQVRVLIHWRNLPSYAAACIAEFRRRFPVATLVMYDRLDDNAPYDRSRYGDIGNCVDITDFSHARIAQGVNEFGPDVALVGGWVRCARTIARTSQRQGARIIMACDNQRRQGLRQRLFPLFYHTVLKRIADRFFVPGQRSMDFLVGAGVPSSQIYRGLYSADMDRFSALAESRRTCVAWPKVFLFVGQYIDRKGVPDLLQAFAASSSSWSLVFCGSGPLKQTISTAHPGLKNVSDKGFIQPPDLPATMGQAGAFVMPSREDNWGLALLEAAAAGLPLICSSACGASEDVLREGLNGFAFPPGDVKALTRTLDGVAGADVAELKGMSGESICRASEYSAERWADRFWASVQSVFTGRTHQTVTSASAQIPGGCTK